MEIDRNKLIGERVRFYRTTREISMDNFVKELPIKITGQQFARYETGLSRWPADLLVETAIALRVDIRLLTGTEDCKHEGKESEEWDAEKYKTRLLVLPLRVRKLAYRIIDMMRDATGNKEPEE